MNKIIVAALLVGMLTGCAGSPARNLMAGNGLVCTPPACDGEVTSWDPSKSRHTSSGYVKSYTRKDGTHVRGHTRSSRR